MTEVNNFSSNAFAAPDFIADQINHLEPGVITSTGGLFRDGVWEAFAIGERRVLERFVEELVFERLVPLERVGFDGEDRNLYRKIDS